ncbi:MAG: hypothetical protein F6K31_09995 [Symploca sp. SIO2G7]|nr:hypothetical protein [Symploca sp. SIO2G7]
MHHKYLNLVNRRIDSNTPNSQILSLLPDELFPVAYLHKYVFDRRARSK